MLDCQARALGENGFEVLSGGPIGTACLSAAITIFVALIGYRLLLGTTPSLRDGVGWAVRFGFVLALATSWPAFQTLVYRVVIDAPVELSTTLLAATGIASDDIDQRLQNAYEVLGNGVYSTTTSTEAAKPAQPSQPGADGAAPQNQPQVTSTTLGFPASPQTASLVMLTSVGLPAALRLAVGLLVALGPLAIITLLFDATLGIVSGWVRALAGAALGVLATNIVAALEVTMLEREITRIRAIGLGMLPSTTADPQTFVTIAGVFALVAVVMAWVAFRAAAAFKLPRPFLGTAGLTSIALPLSRTSAPLISSVAAAPGATSRSSTSVSRTRVGAVSDALTAATNREQTRLAASSDAGARRTVPSALQVPRPGSVAPVGQLGRRTSVRRTRAAANRDRAS